MNMSHSSFVVVSMFKLAVINNARIKLIEENGVPDGNLLQERNEDGLREQRL